MLHLLRLLIRPLRSKTRCLLAFACTLLLLLPATLPAPALAQTAPGVETSVSRLGPLLRFARSVPRPPAQPPTHAFTLRPVELRPADDRRIVVEDVVMHLRIADPARFERAYAQDADGMARAQARLQVAFEEELRRAVGRLTVPQLASFDPFALVAEGAPLRRLVDQVGLAVDDLGGETMGYRTLGR